MKSLSRALALALFITAIPLANSNAADGVKITSDVVYGHKMGMALFFDVFQPDNATGAGVLYMVSGGWYSRWREPQTRVRGFQQLLDKGLTVFAVHHGSSPKFNIPEAVGDVRRATRFIKMKSDELGVDPDRLGVWGGSAGGHLSLVLGTTSDEGDPNAADKVLRESSRLAAVVALYPPIDLRGLNSRAMDPDASPPSDPRFRPALTFDPELAASVSPILHVSSDDPPTLLIHGDKDGLVPVTTSKTIHAAFEEKNVTTGIIIIEGAGHGFRGADRTRSLEATADWFAKHLNESVK